MQVDAGTYNALAENSGLIQADDGTVLMSATAKDALLDTVVNNTGIVQARGISKAAADELLTFGFFEEVLNRLESDPLHDTLRTLIQGQFKK